MTQKELEALAEKKYPFMNKTEMIGLGYSTVHLYNRVQLDARSAYLAAYNECEKTYQNAISELRSKILHLEDRSNDFFVLGAFVELENKVQNLPNVYTESEVLDIIEKVKRDAKSFADRGYHTTHIANINPTDYLKKKI